MLTALLARKQALLEHNQAVLLGPGGLYLVAAVGVVEHVAEVRVVGVEAAQIGSKKGSNFSTKLRSSLRPADTRAVELVGVDANEQHDCRLAQKPLDRLGLVPDLCQLAGRLAVGVSAVFVDLRKHNAVARNPGEIRAASWHSVAAAATKHQVVGGRRRPSDGGDQKSPDSELGSCRVGRKASRTQRLSGAASVSAKPD